MSKKGAIGLLGLLIMILSVSMAVATVSPTINNDENGSYAITAGNTASFIHVNAMMITDENAGITKTEEVATSTARTWDQNADATITAGVSNDATVNGFTRVQNVAVVLKIVTLAGANMNNGLQADLSSSVVTTLKKPIDANTMLGATVSTSADMPCSVNSAVFSFVDNTYRNDREGRAYASDLAGAVVVNDTDAWTTDFSATNNTWDIFVAINDTASFYGNRVTANATINSSANHVDFVAVNRTGSAPSFKAKGQISDLTNIAAGLALNFA
ncbi:MAG: hypothetical protein PHR36_02280 [Patescibacteria group bacterium]|nr:hypothetical protein [Patescibacteria group bacterium]